MKKNITINLFGALYAIDEDAYELLERYLDNMKRYFAKREGGDEIADDIEHRVAELLWNLKEQGMDAVDIETVKTVISRIGTPGEFDEETKDDAPDSGSETDACADSSASPESEQAGQGRTAGSAWRRNLSEILGRMRSRRFYRDGKDKLAGGVISGLCHYCDGHDPFLWRLMALFLTVLFFSLSVSDVAVFWEVRAFFRCLYLWILLLYFACWILAPVARSTEEQMRMKGKEITPESLKDETIKEVTEGEKAADGEERNVARGCLARFVEIIVWLFKFLLLVIFSAAVVFSICAVVAAVIYCVNRPLMLEIMNANPDVCETFAAVPSLKGWFVGIAICMLLITGIPLLGILHWLVRRRKVSMGSITLMLIVFVAAWVVGIILTVFSVNSVRAVEDQRRTEKNTRHGIYLDDWSWWYLDNVGWDMAKAGNIQSYIVGSGEDDPLCQQCNFLHLIADYDARPMDCVLTKKETPQAGDYVLEGLTWVDGSDARIVILNASEDTLAYVNLSSRSDVSQTLSSMSWEKSQTLPFFQLEEVDSLTWVEDVNDADRGWQFLSSAPFRHEGGQLTIQLHVGDDADDANSSHCTQVQTSRIRLRRVGVQ